MSRWCSKLLVIVGLVLPCAASPAAELPTGTLRATFIASNPVQARLDPASGNVAGPAADLTRALAEKLGVQFRITPAQGVSGVIESVRSSASDIGFVAFDRTRAEQVDFSQTYLLAHNSYIVRADSPIRRLDDVDREGIRIGAGQGDAADLFLTRSLQRAKLHRVPNSDMAVGLQMVLKGELDAYAGNRTRLLAMAEREPGFRVLDENFYSVEQAIAVPKGNAALLSAVEGMIEEARRSGLVQAAIQKAGLRGVDVAPPRSR